MILTGDVIERLAEIDAGSVQVCVTSPPYWGLRDYGTAKWEGGDAGCDHSPERRGSRFAGPVGAKQHSNTGSGTASRRDCPCGAKRIDAQLGLEPTPAEYVDRMVQVFREVKRVLCKDGTLWLNLGDSYAAGGRGGGPEGGKQATNVGELLGPKTPPPGLKPKDLVGIPWRVALALQADGWYLRSDIIWAKPNPMPESVTDRPTKSHEYLFLLSKSERYYYDAGAIAEPSIHAGEIVKNGSDRIDSMSGTENQTREGFKGSVLVAQTRNARSVWSISTSPYPEAHFATFPPELPRRCILAGSKPGDTVLDPFAGAGTTMLVAEQLGRKAIGIELNPAYVALAERRIAEDPQIVTLRTQVSMGLEP